MTIGIHDFDYRQFFYLMTILAFSKNVVNNYFCNIHLFILLLFIIRNVYNIMSCVLNHIDLV